MDRETQIQEKELIEQPETLTNVHVYDIITSRKPDWQTIIYDLISTEQLDPWNIDVIILTKKYFERLEEMEHTDFYISSKVLLAAALLLRIKSEILLNKSLKSIDEILFGKKEWEKASIERIELDESELPLLIPRTPLPRARKVTLPELLNALNQAIHIEGKRIKREVSVKRAQRLSELAIPEVKRIDLKDRIKQFYAHILTRMKKQPFENELQKIGYKELIGMEKEEKIATFLPLLHLSNSKRLWLEQHTHLEEIWIYLYEHFEKNKEKFIETLAEDIEHMKEELEEEIHVEEIIENLDNNKKDKVFS